MSRLRLRTVGVVLCAGLLAACAGSVEKRTTPRRAVGHGSVAEVITAMALERLPCSDPQPQPLDGYEEAVTCRLGSQSVTIVHYADPTQAERFEQELKAADAHGVQGVTWGARVPTEVLAKRIAGALENASVV